MSCEDTCDDDDGRYKWQGQQQRQYDHYRFRWTGTIQRLLVSILLTTCRLVCCMIGCQKQQQQQLLVIIIITVFTRWHRGSIGQAMHNHKMYRLPTSSPLSFLLRTSGILHTRRRRFHIGTRQRSWTRPVAWEIIPLAALWASEGGAQLSQHTAQVGWMAGSS